MRGRKGLQQNFKYQLHFTLQSSHLRLLLWLHYFADRNPVVVLGNTPPKARVGPFCVVRWAGVRDIQGD